MRGLVLAACAAVMVMATGAGAATLNKCIDAQGGVTYSNLPCRNAQQVRAVEIDPAPPPAPATRPAAPKPVAEPPPSTEPPARLKIDAERAAGKPPSRSSQRECDAIAEKLGSVLDKMDAARRKGYTQEKMDAWNEQVRALERKKQQAGCF